MWSKLDEPGLFLLNAFFRCPDLKTLNPALNVVSSVLSPLLRCLFLFRCGLALLSLAFESPEFLGVMLLRASQLSLPAQKRVMSVVGAAMDFGFSWPICRASHSSRMLCLKATKASASGQSTIWFFLVRN